MAAPHIEIIEPGVVMSRAKEDLAEGELRTTIQVLSNLVRDRVSVPEIVQAEIARSVQSIETWLRLLKSGLDEFQRQQSRLDTERRRLQEEVLDLRRREGWDPSAHQLRLRTADSLHKVGQDELKLVENWRKEQLSAKEAVLEAHGLLLKHAGRLDQLGMPRGDLPSAQALFDFIDCAPPREVLIINPPLVIETILPPRLP